MSNDTDLKPIPDKSLQIAIASALDWPKTAIKWSRMRTSSVNYVYRARYGKDSVVIKHSDNTVIKTQWDIPPNHLHNEYTFLKLGQTSEVLAPHLPQPLTFLETENVLIMSDVGRTRFLIHHGFPWFRSKRETFGQTGRLLATIHGFDYPDTFRRNIDLEQIYSLVTRFKLEPLLHEGWDYLADFRPGADRDFVLLDFSPRNMLHNRISFHLIDFDLITLGYQLFDVAHFLSYVAQIAFRRGDRKLMASLKCFLTSYCQERGNGLEANRVISDEKFLKYFTSMFFHKLSHTRLKMKEDVIRTFLLDFSQRRFDTWADFTSHLFTLRLKLR
ncbi:aminoglycoside phosphotransferase family protein [bacterium]|nr:aminoglycoside phosphotransferase family protein [bacterium]